MPVLTEEMRQLVEQQRLGFVATVCRDGAPSLSPKGTTAVWDEGHLIFADISSAGTVANLRHDPRVEVNVVDPFTRKGYRFKGVAMVLSEGPQYEAGLTFYRERGVRAPIHHIVLIRVQRAAPLISPAYADGSSEDAMRARWKRHYQSLLGQDV
jgi:predicted pyridoxine 5'-phosphate oxidase superfamily flavin-nucleotide-binding protein